MPAIDVPKSPHVQGAGRDPIITIWFLDQQNNAYGPYLGQSPQGRCVQLAL